jgi:transposase
MHLLYLFNMMTITEQQYQLLAPCLPKQRGNVTIPNLQVLNGILYVAEQGCKWRALPKHFGKWHTIYTRMNRWAKKGVLARVFEEILRLRMVKGDWKIENLSLDSTSIKVHPDGTGAQKKRPASHRGLARGAKHENSSGRRG